jgi:hypothetical protein
MSPLHAMIRILDAQQRQAMRRLEERSYLQSPAPQPRIQDPLPYPNESQDAYVARMRAEYTRITKGQ